MPKGFHLVYYLIKKEFPPLPVARGGVNARSRSSDIGVREARRAKVKRHTGELARTSPTSRLQTRILFGSLELSVPEWRKGFEPLLPGYEPSALPVILAPLDALATLYRQRSAPPSVPLTC